MTLSDLLTLIELICIGVFAFRVRAARKKYYWRARGPMGWVSLTVGCLCFTLVSWLQVQTYLRTGLLEFVSIYYPFFALATFAWVLFVFAEVMCRKWEKWFGEDANRAQEHWEEFQQGTIVLGVTFLVFGVLMLGIEILFH